MAAWAALGCEILMPTGATTMITRNAGEVLEKHVTLDIEGIDRIGAKISARAPDIDVFVAVLGGFAGCWGGWRRSR
jgi:hypothetical protein